jgi:hypothetical protein
LVQIHYRPPQTLLREASTNIPLSPSAPKEPGPKSSGDTDTPSDDEIRSLLKSSLRAETGLTPLRGFKVDLSANAGFRKFFYSAKCECGTAALLSVEIDARKDLKQIERVMPELARRLESQAGEFNRMSCEDHSRMRMGPAAAARDSRR